MNLEQALQQLRRARVEPPTFQEIEQRRRWKAERALPEKRLRIALVATLVAIVGYLILTIRPLTDYLYRFGGGLDEWWRVSLGTVVPAALLGWGYVCARRASVGPQMLSRAIWWSNLLVGMLIAGNFMVPFDRFVGAAIAIACAVPLLALGSRGLDAAPGDPFQPVRFRGHLLLALVMAFADAQTLLFSAVMQLRVGVLGWNLAGTIDYAGPAALAAMVMALAVWGLYRLRTWALLLNLVANFAIAWLAMDGVLNLAPPVALALFATAACQALLPVPILAIALGDRRAGRPWLLGHAPKLLPLSVIAIAGAAVVLAVTVRHPDGWLTGPGRAFRRGIELVDRGPTVPRRGLPFGSGSRVRADLSGATRLPYGVSNFSEANLTDARLAGAVLEKKLFVGADLSRGDFTGASLAQSDMTNAKLVAARLAHADLRGVALAGANLEGADLFGAKIDAMSPEIASGIRWGSATCPDGVTADAERGCIGHEGQLPAAEHARYTGTFRIERAWGEHCETTGLRTAVVAGGHLFFADAFYSRQAEDAFVSANATLRYERSEGEVRIVVESEGCRRQYLRADQNGKSF